MKRTRWWVLCLLSVAELLGMSVWLAASAATSEIRAVYDLGPGAAVWFTTLVQLGFVAGTALAAVLNLADLLPSRLYFAVSAVLAASCNALMLLELPLAAALASRFLTGACLAGVYPPAMKMAATWFRSGRGMAIGTIVGALTLGKAAPFLLGSFQGGLVTVFGAASLGAVAAALLVLLFYRDGPHPFERRAFSWRLVGTVLRHRETRLATLGYLGHMWELYAVWTAIAVFLGVHARAIGLPHPESWSSLWAFVIIGVGCPGAILAGLGADRWGREGVASAAMAVSGACALLMGWLAGAPTVLVLGVGVCWGFAVVADSAQFSALVTEVAPSHAAGDRTHASDVSGLPPHHGHRAGHSLAGRAIGLGTRLRHPVRGTGPGDRGHGPAAAFPSSRRSGSRAARLVSRLERGVGTERADAPHEVGAMTRHSPATSRKSNDAGADTAALKCHATFQTGH